MQKSSAFAELCLNSHQPGTELAAIVKQILNPRSCQEKE